MTSEVTQPSAAAGADDATARRSPLEARHLAAGAVLRVQDGAQVPATYGDPRAEYEAVRGGEKNDDATAGLIDLSSRGRVEVSGAEAVQFLNGMLTNDVARLEDGAWMLAAFPNPQGRLVATARIARRGDRFIFDTEPATYERVRKALERFTLAGDFRVHDLTSETAALSLQGPGAARVVAGVLGEEASSVARNRVLAATFEGAEVQVMRATHTAEDGFDLTIEAGGAEAVWDALAAAGARAVGFDALEVLRVEAGLPRYGVDAGETNVVLEVVDEQEAVSYTKGCYVGQEIIARIHWRGHVAKQLAGLVFDREVDAPAVSAAVLKSCEDGREVGRVTSAVYSPRLRGTIALGLVKYDYLKPGVELKTFAGDQELCHAHVAELPLVRGGWHEGVESTSPSSSTTEHGAE